MTSGFALLILLYAFTYSPVSGEEFKTKQFSVIIPDGWELVTSSEKHINDIWSGKNKADIFLRHTDILSH